MYFVLTSFWLFGENCVFVTQKWPKYKNVARNLSPMPQKLSKTFKRAKLIISILGNMHHFWFSNKQFVFLIVKILIVNSSNCSILLF